MQPKTRNILVILICAMVLAIGGGYVALYLVVSAMIPSETTAVRRYATVLKDWQASKLVGHFPAAVPAHARNVRFSAIPAFLQGGAHIQLRMQLPADEIKQIEAQLQQATTHAYAGGDKYDHYNRDSKNNLPTTSFYTADDPKKTFAFPQHYTLYVLGASPYGNVAQDWNHGHTHGTAVSTTANEVIYWAESW